MLDIKNDEQGLSVIFFAIIILALISVTALAVDGGNLLRRQSQLQVALDSASLQAATLLYRGKSTSDAASTARKIVEANLELSGVKSDAAKSVADNLSINFLDSDTKVVLAGDIPEKYWFASAITGGLAGQNVHASSAATFTKDEPGTAQPVNYIFVIDSSQSMQHALIGSPANKVNFALYPSTTTKVSYRKIDALYMAMLKFISSLNGDEISIHKFGGTSPPCQTVLPRILINDEYTGLTIKISGKAVAATNRQYALTMLSNIRVLNGETPIACGLDLAAIQLEDMYQKADPKLKDTVLALLSDGGPTWQILSNKTRKNLLASKVGGWCAVRPLVTWPIQIADMIKKTYGIKIHSVAFMGKTDNANTPGLPNQYDYLKRIASVPCSLTNLIQRCESTKPPRDLVPIPEPVGSFYLASTESILFDVFKDIGRSVTQTNGGPRRINPS